MDWQLVARYFTVGFLQCRTTLPLPINTACSLCKHYDMAVPTSLFPRLFYRGTTTYLVMAKYDETDRYSNDRKDCGHVNSVYPTHSDLSLTVARRHFCCAQVYYDINAVCRFLFVLDLGYYLSSSMAIYWEGAGLCLETMSLRDMGPQLKCPLPVPSVGG